MIFLPNARFAGVGAYLPPRVLDNFELATMVDTSDEWITTRTGISTRYISTEDNWRMAARAAQSALAQAGADPLEVDMIIGCTATPDYLFPSLACIVQGQIGASNAFCYDLVAGCTGFVFALDTVQQFVTSGRVKTALIVASEMLSRLTDYTDRRTCVLFGDGAGAAVLRSCNQPDFGVLASHALSDGTGGHNLYSRGLLGTSYFQTEHDASLFAPDDDRFIHMNGQGVYKFAVHALGRTIDALCEKSGFSMADIDLFIPHQANVRIIKSVIDRYGLDPDKVVINIDRYANTSSATIPICLDEAAASGRLKKGDLVCLVGFGAGLTCGGSIVRW